MRLEQAGSRTLVVAKLYLRNYGLRSRNNDRNMNKRLHSPQDSQTQSARLACSWWWFAVVGSLFDLVESEVRDSCTKRARGWAPSPVSLVAEPR